MTPSRIHQHLPAGTPPLVLSPDSIRDVAILDHLGALGIAMDARTVQAMMPAAAMDGLQPTMFPAGVPTPLQFLQTFLPGFVRVLTQAEKIDELIGVSTVGRWEDEEILQGVMEAVGLAAPYGDLANIPLASWNPGWERRTVVRFEQGFRTGPLEVARAAAGGIDSNAEKRNAATASLEFTRNEVGFFGYNDGQNRTFGLLNDPGLPPLSTAPAGTGGGTAWSTKTFQEIIADLRFMLEGLRTRSGDRIDPTTTSITLAVPTSAMGAFGATTDFGISVADWLAKTYRNVRVVSAPQLEDANGGASVAYVWADAIEDGSTDNGRTWEQLVPEKFRLLGSEDGAKHHVEDFTNALAGVMLKRPFAVYGLTGI